MTISIALELVFLFLVFVVWVFIIINALVRLEDKVRGLIMKWLSNHKKR